MILAEVIPAPLVGRHVLVLPAGTDVRPLAAAWFPGAVWERQPLDPGERPAAARPTGARFRGIVVEAPRPTTGLLRLDASAALDGPVRLGEPVARALGLGARELDAWSLVVGAGDDGSGSEPARTDGAPGDPASRHELAEGWTVAAARRVRGAVLPADGSRVVAPDPAAAVDLTLWSPLPLAPQDVVPLVRPALAGARIGPADAPTPEPADPTAQPFSVAAAFEYDGVVTIRAARAREVPLVLSTVDQRQYGTWAYHVAWQPPDSTELLQEQPSQLHLIARSRVTPSVARVAATLWRVAGGTVVDSGGFVVTPDELTDRARDLR
ncbi:hypothetical protein GXP71_17835 [Cellulomonas sp. H30R-01]|uniref:hypothetical protein n=1 Tax=Cellulomonas sp. H30R-01 TaxID=2704467 RepID=UPI00138DC42C|nr:hypothetical protein [Cellulomonas sp. H30R-01]QHT57751.1 hypothetical protein GXP71_17835 [Cellulomonas sp. H30R-01]